LSPLEAADALVHTREIIRNITTIRKKQELTLRSCAESPSQMSVEERGALGITRRLPVTPQEAGIFFEQHEVFKKNL